ncbi:hypothetical protein [Sneathiella chinensis]|uniref:Lipoprotein n=1 Tax=Sneathiella chinensis TaxID=349750 RepID=A0ABQ5U4E4_9PROT|nr:hypothetical protein [Sneathiella chinensis]GLQ05351.1 hypothetical protein GCM10007924_05720 [Sneathiella chinensis]
MIKLNRIVLMVGAALALVLSGCVSTPEKQTFADITFQHLTPINLDVGEIRVVNDFRAPLKAPHVEHELPVKIDQSVTRWVRDRLKAVGNSGSVAVVTIKDASAVETSLEKTTGLSGLVTRDQAELYTFQVDVDLQIQTISGSRGFANAVAKRQKSVPEDISLNDREQVYYGQVERLMQDFDLEMEKNIRQFMSAFVR